MEIPHVQSGSRVDSGYPFGASGFEGRQFPGHLPGLSPCVSLAHDRSGVHVRAQRVNEFRALVAERRSEGCRVFQDPEWFKKRIWPSQSDIMPQRGWAATLSSCRSVAVVCVSGRVCVG
jgi:hypothetical protein